MMYNEKIEALISAALVDGELTEKEKQILYKNAQVMGVDLDEFEMVLQARLFEKQKELSRETIPEQSAAPKSNKFGDIRKCPQCGAVVDAYTAICTECGYAFNNVTNNSEIKLLAQRLEDLEENREEPVTETQEKKKLGFWGVVGWIYFFWILIPIKVVKSIIGMISKSSNPKLWTKTDKKMEGVIMNYAVPNTKSELIEFAVLCQSHIKSVRFFKWLTDEGAYNLKWNTVWQSKLTQINTKAQLALKSDQVGLKTINDLYVQAEESTKRNRNSMLILLGITLAILIAIIVIIACLAN